MWDSRVRAGCMIVPGTGKMYLKMEGNMSSVFLAVLVFVLFYLAYRFYAKKIEHVLGVDPQKETPAHTKYDGIDYIPAKNWLVLFGHHFSSIAGLPL